MSSAESSESSRISRCRLTSDDEVGLRLEVFGGEFDLSGFIQLDVPQSQAVDFTLRLQHHLSGSTESVTQSVRINCQYVKGFTFPKHHLSGLTWSVSL